jgi:predicted nucleic acid-binding protein
MPAALLDTNVLVHAMYRQSSLHSAAAQLVDRGLRERGVYCIAPQNLVEFAAVMTRPRFVSPTPPGAEIRRITELLYRSRRLTKIYPARGTVIRAMREGAGLGVSGPRWYDLFLAMTMADAGVRVVITEDVNDFRLFPFVTARDLRETV